MTNESIKSLIEFTDSISRLKGIAVKQLLEIASSCQELRNKPENKPLYQFNLLDIVATHEPHTSEFLSIILSYIENGKYIILESFIERFLSLVGLNKSRINKPRITAEIAHIDVRILDDDYAIIIENKLMNAPFQRNQLGRYIEDTHMRHGYPYEKIFLIILPQYFNPNLLENLRPSVWRCPPDGLKTSNYSRKCAHLDQYQCWCDDDKKSLSQGEQEHCQGCMNKDIRALIVPRSVVIQSSLSDWLFDIEQVIDSKQTILRSAIHQFADFTQGLFSLRINNNLLMDIKNLIRETLFPEGSSKITQWNILKEKCEELPKIQSAMADMKLQFSKDLIDEWYHELKPEFDSLQREVQKSFGINIHGVWVGCWCGSDNNGSPYWGFYCEIKEQEERQKRIDMVNAILDECDLPSKPSGNFISKNNTRNGAKRCRNIYNAAKKLGYLK